MLSLFYKVECYPSDTSLAYDFKLGAGDRGGGFAVPASASALTGSKG
jgi:hypothetical protein